MYPDSTHISYPEFYVCFLRGGERQWREIKAQTWRQALYLFEQRSDCEVVYIQEYLSPTHTITHYLDGTHEERKRYHKITNA